MISNHFLKNLLGVLFFLPVLSLAQQSPQDTSFVASSIRQAKKIYTQNIQGQAHLYNGSDYKEYNQIDDEHPYFISDDWVLGTVEYYGEHFDNVPLLYDISSDLVITENYYSSNKMQLVNELLKAFTIQEHKFVRLDRNASKNLNIKTGFYEMLYDGRLKVYSRITKTLQERISVSKIEAEFDQKTRYFMYKNEVFYEVSSKASVLQVLGDKKHELKRFVKSNHIRFKKNKKNAIVAMANYYEELNR
jgi:hypothetical protein